jgi:hypothetical protein
MFNVTKTQKTGFFLVLLCLVLIAGCSTVKVVEVWKDDTYNERMGKVLVIAMANQDYIRKQFENVLANQLVDRGVEVVRSFNVWPQRVHELDKQMVLDKVAELGVSNVLVTRSVHHEEITNYQAGGLYFAPTATYLDGWYSYAVGTVRYREMAYDTDYLTVSTHLFALGNKKPVWTNLIEIKVEDSRQDAVNKFVPMLVEQMELSQVL